MFYRILADIVVAAHVAYVSYVVLGQLLIWIGLALRWAWVRIPWFRWSHLVMMSIVGVEAVLNIQCPLTTLEARLREWGGEASTDGSFVGRLLHDLLFVDWPPWVLTILHISFALIVLGTFVLAPPRRRPRSPQPVKAPNSNAIQPAGTE